jgi:hypothetical protein
MRLGYLLGLCHMPLIVPDSSQIRMSSVNCLTLFINSFSILIILSAKSAKTLRLSNRLLEGDGIEFGYPYANQCQLCWHFYGCHSAQLHVSMSLYLPSPCHFPSKLPMADCPHQLPCHPMLSSSEAPPGHINSPTLFPSSISMPPHVLQCFGQPFRSHRCPNICFRISLGRPHTMAATCFLLDPLLPHL